jgi:hypothetical protein
MSIPAVGTKAMVWHGTARHTSGGLTKKDLMKHHGRIISRKKHAAGKKAIKHLFALGYKPKKGTFKIMRKSMRKSRKSMRKSRKRRGGSDEYEEEHEQEQ